MVKQLKKADFVTLLTTDTFKIVQKRLGASHLQFAVHTSNGLC